MALSQTAYWFTSATAAALAILISYGFGRYDFARKRLGWPLGLTIVLLIKVAMVSLVWGLMRSPKNLPIAIPIAAGIFCSVMLFLLGFGAFVLGVNYAWESQKAPLPAATEAKGFSSST